MRAAFYADARDVAKWTLLTWLARHNNLKNVVQVTMHHSPRDARDGIGAEPTIQKFFVGERSTVDGEFGRILARAERLSPIIGFEVRVDGRPFDPRNRNAYFNDELKRLVEKPPAVVLLDPDTGVVFEKDRAGPEHVTIDEVRFVLRAVHARSVLAIFQYNTRRRGWRTIIKQQIESELGLPVAKFNAGPVSYYLMGMKRFVAPDNDWTAYEHGI